MPEAWASFYFNASIVTAKYHKKNFEKENKSEDEDEELDE